jgi:hypothetical protein
VTQHIKRVLGSLVLGVSLALAALLPASAQEARQFTVWNKTDIVFAQLFVSPTTTTDWGDDYLGTQVLNPGDGWKMTFSKFAGGQCLYDVKVVGKAGEEGKLIGVDLCKLDTITFSPKLATPREQLEKWLGATGELSKIGIDPSNTTADYTTNADGSTTILALRSKDTTAKSGINISISQTNSAETANAAVLVVGDQKKAEGWQIDNTTPQGVGDRAWVTGAQVSPDLATLFYAVQVYDRVAVVSVTAPPEAKDQIATAASSLLVDLLKQLDPSVK